MFSILTMTRYTRKQHCFTDGNGPEVFKKCALKWVSPHEKILDDFGQYENTDGHWGCSTMPPPSAQNELCKTLHGNIEQLR